MTRTEDTLLYDHYNDLENYKGRKKIYDLKNRVRITEEYENPIYIGIHMNSFPSSKYKGLQVYYSKNNSASLTLAEAIQGNTSKYIQEWNGGRRPRLHVRLSSIWAMPFALIMQLFSAATTVPISRRGAKCSGP
jgi:N-acetylmuramoyl-L-alanine amidase